MRRTPACAALLVGLAGAGAAAERPAAVSPGSATGTVVESRCPAFSWSAVSGAAGYELVAYRVGSAAAEAVPALRVTLPAAATLWTPGLDLCLERGGRYAWSVRALVGDVASDWSPPSLFEVAAGPSERELLGILDLAGRTLATAAAVAGVPAPSRGLAPSASGGAGLAPGAPAALAAAGDPALSVNGAAVLTTATFGPGLCGALTYRFVDQGDGTVLDCNTGRVWLKDADCIGQWPWSDAEPSTTAFAKVAALNAGADFGCTDYTPGAYTDWELPLLTDFCSAGNALGSGVCPAGSASDSLIDSSVTGFTKVESARGNGSWAQGDAFVDVRAGGTDRYWTASCFESCLIDAYQVYFFDGSFSPGSQSPLYWVWPVRAAP